MDRGAYGILLVFAVLLILLVIFYFSELLSGSGLNNTCKSQSACQDWLVCETPLTPSTSGICKVGFGQKCNGNDDCTRDHFCIAGKCQSGLTDVVNGNTGISKDIVKNTPVVSSTVATKPNPIRPVTNTRIGFIPLKPNTKVNNQTELSEPKPIITQKPSQNNTRAMPVRDIIDQMNNPYNQVGSHAIIIDSDISEVSDASGITIENTEFDIPSYSSPRSSYSSGSNVSVPYATTDAGNFCKGTEMYQNAIKAPNTEIPKITNVSKSPIESEPPMPVIDVSSFSSYKLVLMQNSDIIRESSDKGTIKRQKIRNNINITKLEDFGGYLHGLCEGEIYRLDNGSLDSAIWKWNKAGIPIIGIRYINATLDRSNLWVETANQGYLLDSSYKIIEEVEYPGKRVYGMNKETYLEIKNGMGVLYPKKIEYPGINSGVVYHDGTVMTLGPDDSDKLDIRLVNWEPYYIMK